MENEKITPVLNEVIINKLESISFDIKYYININASIAKSLDEECLDAFKFMDDGEINELMEIRNRIKRLVYNLKNKLDGK